MDPIDPMSAGAHSVMARMTLRKLETHTGGNWTVDQAIAIAQIHATLAVAAALTERRIDG